jgi:hypothetical protein
MSEKGQSRHSEGAPITSGLPQQTDISRDGRHVSKVPPTDILPIQTTLSANSTTDSGDIKLRFSLRP